MAACKRGLKRGLKSRKRLVILFTDTTWFTQVPPLRAMWARKGSQPRVPIVGAMRRIGLTGVMNIRTGRLWQYASEEYNLETFEEVLINVRRIWRGWNIVFFVDKHSAQKSPKAVSFAHELGIELRFLPTAASRLNPMEDLWRYLKNEVIANEPTPNLEATIKIACAHLRSLSSRERLRKAGILSENFWLSEFVKKK